VGRGEVNRDEEWAGVSGNSTQNQHKKNKLTNNIAEMSLTFRISFQKY
jgi:hypothetical protein